MGVFPITLRDGVWREPLHGRESLVTVQAPCLAPPSRFAKDVFRRADFSSETHNYFSIYQICNQKAVQDVTMRSSSAYFSFIFILVLILSILVSSSSQSNEFSPANPQEQHSPRTTRFENAPDQSFPSLLQTSHSEAQTAIPSLSTKETYARVVDRGHPLVRSSIHRRPNKTALTLTQIVVPEDGSSTSRVNQATQHRSAYSSGGLFFELIAVWMVLKLNLNC